MPETTADSHPSVAGTHDRTPILAGFETAAIRILRTFIRAGMAGLDCYDHSSFIVDLPFGVDRDSAEIALDCLGASHHAEGNRFRCELQGVARAALGLDAPGAPELLMPLASRAVGTQGPAALREAKAAYDRRYPEGQVH